MYRRESEGKELPMSPPNNDDGVQQLLADFRNGYLTRRGFLAKAAAASLSSLIATPANTPDNTRAPPILSESHPPSGRTNVAITTNPAARKPASLRLR